MKAQLREVITPIPESELILRKDLSQYHIGLSDEHLAHQIILVGDQDRVPLISKHMDEVEIKRQGREFVFHTGRIGKKRLTVLSSGIGVDNIDIVMNELDAAVNIDPETRLIRPNPVSLEIVRLGTSGSIHPDIPTGSFVASTHGIAIDGVPYTYAGCEPDEEEAELTASIREQVPSFRHNSMFYVARGDQELLNRIGHDMIQGITVTANGFYGPQGRSLRLKSNVEEELEALGRFRKGHLRITNFEMECSGIYALSGMLGHKALTVCTIVANRATKEFHKNTSASIETLIHQVVERF